jgi:hypothetical protein
LRYKAATMVATPNAAPSTAPIDYPEVVNPRRRAFVMVMVATALAAGICALVFAACLYADFLTSPLQGVADFFFAHSALAVAAATSPLFAALLVGYGYMQRAMRRRAAEKQAASTAEPSAVPSGSLH